MSHVTWPLILVWTRVGTLVERTDMGSGWCLPGLPQKRASTLTKLQIKGIKTLIFYFSSLAILIRIYIQSLLQYLPQSTSYKWVDYLTFVFIKWGSMGRSHSRIPSVHDFRSIAFNGMNNLTNKRCFRIESILYFYFNNWRSK